MKKMMILCGVLVCLAGYFGCSDKRTPTISKEDAEIIEIIEAVDTCYELVDRSLFVTIKVNHKGEVKTYSGELYEE